MNMMEVQNKGIKRLKVRLTLRGKVKQKGRVKVTFKRKNQELERVRAKESKAHKMWK